MNGDRAVPGVRWMLASPARTLALGFGSGLLKPAPGTWGTLFGWAVHAAWLRHLDTGWRLAVVVLAFCAGVWACGRAGRDLGVADHGALVWDEVVAIWLLLALAPTGWMAEAVAVLLFRLFDITKPPPIRQLDARLKNGLGVMADDLLAAAYAWGVLVMVWRVLT